LKTVLFISSADSNIINEHVEDVKLKHIFANVVSDKTVSPVCRNPQMSSTGNKENYVFGCKLYLPVSRLFV